MREPIVDLNLAREHGLSDAEFETACQIMGRTPSYTELGIFSAMWSEHCSYKSSKVHLKRFPTKGPQVLIGPGENAGAVDIGDGYAVVFKMESHNHPSFIEPYQGAATGVGGILRDVFTMGARPIANMNALRFGDPNKDHMKYLVRRVTRGIGDYGNCVGVPTVGGEVFFDSAFQGNILVNAMTVGLARKDGIFLGEATGEGNSVMYVGSKTGRDGIHGATMASEEFNEEAEKKRPTVQVGDPFTEKLLLEALLELFPTGAILGIQDMGAAGLTSSSFEMAGRGGTGLDLDLSKVPTREENMTAYEIMLSESQERMLLVCSPNRVEEIAKTFEKWDLEAAVIGTVTNTGRVRIKSPQGEDVVDMPVAPLADKAPMYERPYAEPAEFQAYRKFDLSSYTKMDKQDVPRCFKQLLCSPNIASRAWFYRQYDYTVQTNTVKGPGSAEAAIIRIKDTEKAIAISTDCNPRFVHLNPKRGGAMAVAEAARNISCTGALPLAITDCLNFGSPENPHVMWQFKEAVDGMCEACEELQTPVVSGNVSFYNETNGRAVLPTPAVGMVGLLEDSAVYATNTFEAAGMEVFLIGDTKEELGGSEYLSYIHGVLNGEIPELDLAFERKLQAFVRDAVRRGLVKHARDCSEGGLSIALAECCFGVRGHGVTVDIQADVSLVSAFFGESTSRVVVALNEGDAGSFRDLAKEQGLPIYHLGKTGGDRLVIKFKGETVLDESVTELARFWGNSLSSILD